MVEPLQLPEIPPDGPWSAYVLVIIWLPLLFRIMFLLFPFRRALARLVPHTKWALKALRDLPIRGIGLLVANEIIAFTIPPVVVLTLRFFFDPIGWRTWCWVHEDHEKGTAVSSRFVGFCLRGRVESCCDRNGQHDRGLNHPEVLSGELIEHQRGRHGSSLQGSRSELDLAHVDAR